MVLQHTKVTGPAGGGTICLRLYSYGTCLFKGSAGGSRAGFGSGNVVRHPCQVIAVGTRTELLLLLLAPARRTVCPSIFNFVGGFAIEGAALLTFDTESTDWELTLAFETVGGT